MKSQTSLLNKGLFSHFSGTIFWLTVVFMAMNIIALPLSLWIVTYDRDLIPGYTMPDNLLFQMSAGQIIIGMIFSVFLAMFLLNYLNDEASSDFMHSLPIKRTAVLTHALMTGFAAITIPLLITAVILLLERIVFIPEIALMEIGKWLLYSIFVNCVIFLISVFAGFLVNGIFLHLQMILLALFLPLALWGLIYGAAAVLFDGISQSFIEHSEPVLNATFPYIAVTQLYSGLDVTLNLVWAIIAAVLLLLSFVLYRYRKNEYVTDSFNYQWLKSALVAVLSTGGMLAMGTAVSLLVIPLSVTISIVGFIIGAIVTYIIAEMLFQKNAKIDMNWKTFLLTLIVIGVFWAIFIPAWSNYTSSVPEASKVDSVYVSSDYEYYTNTSIEEYFEDGFLYDNHPRTIQNAVNIHEAAVQEKSVPGNYSGEETAILNIKYKMTDGTVMSRSFSTLKADAPLFADVNNLKNSQYDINSDFLANLKQHPDMIDLTLFSGMVNADKSFIDDYKENTDALMSYNPYIVNQTGQVEMSANYKNNYESGFSSIYNSAVLDRIHASDISVSDTLFLDQSSAMYVAEPEQADMADFFTDYHSLNIEELTEKYNLKALSAAEKEETLTAVNNGELAPEGNKLLLFSYPNYTATSEDYAADIDFSIIAIQ
ncbi:ABC-2 type transport system permease protein [Jeotgalicoccus aerolatus]|uniref:ABC-2 type transport system permease protein n=1 Tax=Jeotgalicoccus aerolatus TaxID=709510 RepID=A0A1G9CC15_9STAP|nr:hypothetical protein [Jeotgalicoccus aerolatus]SDK49228.1 ABC-2 type transport system permease protein [Jeotgalicoccus aerolatus]